MHPNIPNGDEDVNHQQNDSNFDSSAGNQHQPTDSSSPVDQPEHTSLYQNDLTPQHKDITKQNIPTAGAESSEEVFNKAATQNKSPAQPQSATIDSFAGAGISTEQQLSNNKSRKKPTAIIAVIVSAIFIFGGGAAAYFGYVVPNKPENIWRTALVNTGKGYDKLIEYSDEANEIKGWEHQGNFKISGGLVGDGTFSGKNDENTSQMSGSMSAAGMKVGFDFRTFPSASSTPDIYIKFEGLQGLGTLIGYDDPEFTEALNGINNQWYFIDHTLFDQLSASAEDETQIKSDDVISLLKNVGKTSKEYVFTDDTEKAVFTIKEKIGKEQRDGRDVYHYKVNMNKKNLKPYLQNLCKDIEKSKFNSMFNYMEYDCNSVEDLTKDINENDTVDAWVDTKTKLIHSIRITDKKNKDSFVELGQRYVGGDVMPFNIKFSSKEDGLTTVMNMDTIINTASKESNIKGKFNFSGTDETDTDATFSIVMKPSKGKVTVEKPANAKTIIELANDLGFGGLLGDTTNVEDPIVL